MSCYIRRNSRCGRCGVGSGCVVRVRVKVRIRVSVNVVREEWVGLAWVCVVWVWVVWVGMARIGIAWVWVAWCGFGWHGFGWRGFAWSMHGSVVRARVMGMTIRPMGYVGTANILPSASGWRGVSGEG